MPGAGKVGLELDGLLVVAAGLVELALGLVNDARVEPDDGPFRG